ncbi:class I SAM-dependent methyltransferase [Methylomonas koyamae]|uniref:class I SAM-dependent methyltransferase n=1 Tax=Methylomonas koyamae TaxID=702114 RepID=UPI000A797ADA|nr:class I SAM-dependent methyltransferase [Methylomonas koyamae]
MLADYFTSLYRRTMAEAYSAASREIVSTLKQLGGPCLDCGADSGGWFYRLADEVALERSQYFGIEWNADAVAIAQQNQLNIQQGNLNNGLPFASDSFNCIFALSVLEHLLNGCQFLQEAKRALKPGGKLVILTPNISTYFTAALILAGRMPSSGPHPDSDLFNKTQEIFKVSPEELVWDTETDTPVHRHLVVFSFLALQKYLKLLGFSNVTGYGFGLYPLPNFLQPIAEKIDPYHCHQMVFVAQK